MELRRRAHFCRPVDFPLALGLNHLCAVEETLGPGTECAADRLNLLTLHLTLAGRARLEMAGETAFHAPGTVILMRKGAWFRERVAGAPWHSHYLMVGGPLVDALSARLDGDARPLRTFPGASPRWRGLLRECVELALARGPEWQWRFLGRFTDLCADLAVALGPGGRDPRQGSGDLAGKVGALVDRDPARTWRIPDLSRGLKLSPSTLTHRFKRETGQPLAAWIRSRRMGLAADLLVRGLPVGHVASSLGIPDAAAFSRQFKAAHGQAPSALVKGITGTVRPGRPDRDIR